MMRSMYTAHSNSKSRRGGTTSIVKVGYSLYSLGGTRD